MFKPMLAPSKTPDLEGISYPMLASFKLDGIRCVFIDGEMLTRSLKKVPNKFLQDKYEPLKRLSKEKGIIIDGELYSHSSTFQEIYSDVMTGYKSDVAADLCFMCFDSLGDRTEPFDFRWLNYLNLAESHPLVPITQVVVTSKFDVDDMFELALAEGYEGFILKHPHGRYKFGRATLKEGTEYKVKPWENFDGQVLSVNCATRVNEGVERSVNELGRSVTSKKLGDRHDIGIAATLTVMFEGNPVDVTLTGVEAYRRQIWLNQDLWIGKWITYKGMLVGAKDVPRHAVFLHVRDDKLEDEDEA